MRNENLLKVKRVAIVFIICLVIVGCGCDSKTKGQTEFTCSAVSDYVNDETLEMVYQVGSVKAYKNLTDRMSILEKNTKIKEYNDDLPADQKKDDDYYFLLIASCLDTPEFETKLNEIRKKMQ